MKLLKRARFICLAASLMLAGSLGVAHADTIFRQRRKLEF
jgi:hypothetical protein